MNNTKKSPILKTLVGISLSLTVVFSGSMLITPQSAHAATASSSSIASNLIGVGQQFMGVPYKFGASSGRTDVFDCSSFTQYVYKQVGIKLPRSSRQQATVGSQVPKDQLQPGDLVFSDTNRDGIINHVSIYMGNGKLLHTYRVGIGVTISNFKGSAWDRTFVTARRVLPNDGQAGAVAPQPEPGSQPQPGPGSQPQPGTGPQPEPGPSVTPEPTPTHVSKHTSSHHKHFSHTRHSESNDNGEN
ncbi:hypothetical protein Back11_18680 [Paenibacillus baekrokdamisoli]|uniref:Uncharacterized protein n=1 Tax=Paenibacillus baekrokdamisoli TaxID=1712516 RepID=A0A3G9J6Q8_9BACL|nr:NlpC/P60 family protein [Paenibacillus baekrokdamisoli]MBB3072466.1 hypothetical protein [Paenibacillus baekrokdamisoli]BBH20523.1 hypothetical protein Back11_18680 [Paenibacillus baekrokdamisoli]